MVVPLAQAYSNGIALVVRPDEWEGALLGQSNTPELAWYFPNSNPAHMVVAANETDLSPWYYGMTLLQHGIVHEISHHLKFINGGNDDTHIIDNQNHQLEQLFSGLDINRCIANI